MQWRSAAAVDVGADGHNEFFQVAEDAAAEPVVSQVAKETFHHVEPRRAFEHELDIDLENREVQIKYLGRGNTAGDALVFLPKERILITGDIVVHPPVSVRLRHG